jgi:hypothetical protein
LQLILFRILQGAGSAISSFSPSCASAEHLPPW